MKFALIGHPVAGSLSPRLIAAAYNGRHSYDLLDFEHFDDAWKAFVEGYDGINVTAPFKQDAFARVDELSPQARATGAVNLVVRQADGFVGYNTDVDGVVMALKETGIAFKEALVVGTGGAARAAVYAAQLLGSNTLSVKNIAEECGYKHTSFFIAEFKKYFRKTPLEYRRDLGIFDDASLKKLAGWGRKRKKKKD